MSFVYFNSVRPLRQRHPSRLPENINRRIGKIFAHLWCSVDCCCYNGCKFVFSDTCDHQPTVVLEGGGYMPTLNDLSCAKRNQLNAMLALFFHRESTCTQTTKSRRLSTWRCTSRARSHRTSTASIATRSSGSSSDREIRPSSADQPSTTDQTKQRHRQTK